MVGLGAKFAPPLVETRPLSVPTAPAAAKGILIDTTRCVGCRLCQQTCKQANKLPEDDVPATFLSATTLSVIDMKNISPTANKPLIKPVKRQCMHCQDAACVAVCPVGALYKKENGCVGYDADKCIGCRYCMTACPFGVPKYDWNSPAPKINKCAQGCMANNPGSDRPACVQVCPNNALTYGNRTDLIAMGKDRIANDPGKYVNHIYGEKEIGGTSMLYLSGTPFEQLGFRTDLPQTPLPRYTMDVMEKVPWVLVTVASLLSGIAWWTHRTDEPKLVQAPVEIRER
jgi:formate dehydrogenase iron-sulfur subunit